ncbi:TPA: hypothetical protein ACF2P8_002801, partial [Legionella pneumophila]
PYVWPFSALFPVLKTFLNVIVKYLQFMVTNLRKGAFLLLFRKRERPVPKFISYNKTGSKGNDTRSCLLPIKVVLGHFRESKKQDFLPLLR